MQERAVAYEMSAAGPAIWRTIGLRLAAPSLRPTTLLELAPLRRWSQSRQLWTQRPQKAPSSIAPQLLFTRFSAAAKRHFQIGVSQIKNPLPSQDASDLRHLSFGELQTIFSGPTSVETGNKLLQELQSQRVSGTLDEGIADESETATAEALAWLRKNVPWDEDASINARLDREEEEERTKLVARAERLGLYKSQVTADHVIDEPLPSNEDNPLVYTPQQDTTRNKRLGTSVLQTIRKRNERRSRIEAKAKLKAEETARSEAIKAGLPVTQEEKYLARKAENAVWKAEKMEQARSVFGGKEAQWPDLAPWQRLWPSALMTAGVVGISLLFANFYTPPPPQGRIWPDWPPAITTVGVLITMNVLVFLAWRIVPSQRFLYKHFMSVPGYPRATGLIGNIFSQQKFLHLAVNMVALWIFGTRCESVSFPSLYDVLTRVVQYTKTSAAAPSSQPTSPPAPSLHSSPSLYTSPTPPLRPVF